MSITLTYNFNTQPPTTGVGSWNGVPIAGLSACSQNTLWRSGALCSNAGYWEQSANCQVSSRYFGEAQIYLYYPGLKFSEVTVGIQVDHAYIPPGGQNSVLQLRQDDDLVGPTTLLDTHTFTIISDDTDLSCQDIVLTPTPSPSGDNYLILYLGIWGSANIGVDPEVEARVTSVEIVKPVGLRPSAGGIPEAII